MGMGMTFCLPSTIVPIPFGLQEFFFFFTKLEIFVWHLENTLAGILFTIQLACLSFSCFFPITFVMTSPFLRLERFLKVWKV